jgi:hypothetical protein
VTGKESVMETMLVRLRPHDPRRGFVLRRFTYQGIKFYEERGWYVVNKAVADYLSKVVQRETDPHSPLAFDVATEEEARALDAREEHEAKTRKNAAEAPRVTAGRGDLTGEDLRTSGASKAPATTTTPPAPRPEAEKAKKDRV